MERFEFDAGDDTLVIEPAPLGDDVFRVEIFGQFEDYTQYIDFTKQELTIIRDHLNKLLDASSSP